MIQWYLTSSFWQVLERYYPETAINSPSVGRAGKSRRRRQARQSAMEPLFDNTSNDALQDEANDDLLESVLDVTSISASSTQNLEDPPETSGPSNICNLDNLSRPEQEDTSPILDFEANSLEQQTARFAEYARLALERLHLLPLPTSLLKSVWREVAPDQVCIQMLSLSKALLTQHLDLIFNVDLGSEGFFIFWGGMLQDLVGPFYSLRAVLAPVIESYILLDRLLYLKEQAELVAGKERVTAELVPLFDPSISPRNMAIIAHRGSRLEN